MPQASQNANVDPAEIDKFDRSAHQFWDTEGPFRGLHAMNAARMEFIQRHENLSNRRALDVGCGGGLLAESLRRRNATVVGIDLSIAMVEVARLHAAQAGLAIDYQRISATDLASSHPAHFDIVCCMELLEHVPDPEQLLLTLGQLLAPGGSLFVSTINRNPKSFALAVVAAEYVLGLVPRGTHDYRRFIKPSELARAARKTGLEISAVAGLTFNPLTMQCALGEDIDINYIAALRLQDS
ncbi:MAG: bifunctional 2-polyprenyl-6-hydroxyphenol methylase/3-demethylubiquinol 3-O-methyltransferase UbiG [Steroidobacteraceae bacterium]